MEHPFDGFNPECKGHMSLDDCSTCTTRCLYCGDALYHGADCHKSECHKADRKARIRMGVCVCPALPEPSAEDCPLHGLSPEETDNWHCRGCGENVRFVGYDDRAYPGADCECGAYEAGGRECTCRVTARQVLHIDRHSDGEFNGIFYHEFTIGDHSPADAEISNYTRIECGRCKLIVWAEAEPVTAV